jgi:hypothetical protein
MIHSLGSVRFASRSLNRVRCSHRRLLQSKSPARRRYSLRKSEVSLVLHQAAWAHHVDCLLSRCCVSPAAPCFSASRISSALSSKPGAGSVEKSADRSGTWPRSPCREKRLPSSRAHGAEGASTRLKGGEAVRQIDFDGWCGWAFSTRRLVRPQQPPSLVSPDALFRSRRRVPSPF